jgi:hypothetical protein
MKKNGDFPVDNCPKKASLYGAGTTALLLALHPVAAGILFPPVANLAPGFGVSVGFLLL